MQARAQKAGIELTISLTVEEAAAVYAIFNHPKVTNNFPIQFDHASVRQAIRSAITETGFEALHQEYFKSLSKAIG